MTLNANMKRISLVPGVGGGAAALRATSHTVLSLLKCPRDWWVLWKEWKQGLGGGEPAKAYTSAKQGVNKFSFLHDKLVWDAAKGMDRRSQTSDVTINKINWAYG
jgi:hypothetical protein